MSVDVREGNAPAGWFAADQQTALQDFWNVYDAHYDAILAATMRIALDHPEFGPLVRAMPEAQRERENRESRERLRAAIGGDWKGYEDNLRQQGEVYARIGVSFRGWYELTRALQRLLVPIIARSYEGSTGRMVGALTAMQNFIDHAMASIAQSYLDTKERLIVEQRELAENRARELAASEESLRQKTNLLESILATMRDGVALTDARGKYLVVNAAGRKIIGAGVVSARALDGGMFTGVFREDAVTPFPSQEVPLLRALRGEASDDVEMFVRNEQLPEGVYLRLDGRPMRNAQGEVEGALVTFVDITERKRLEQVRVRTRELEAQNRRIQEASRLKSEFLANMSHELRTPLNAILGFSELLHDEQAGPLTPTQREFLGDVLTSGRHLLQLINDVLDLAKVESGKLEFRPSVLNLESLFQEVTGILRTSAAAKRIRVAVEVDPLVGDVTLDSARLKQVLYNYLSNALKFTGEGGVVTVRARPEGPQSFRVEVEDTGIGIAAQDLRRLFTEFEQLDAGAGKKHGGTGLGLALTRSIVEAQGGSVGVRSVQGRGSVFHAVLPRVAIGGGPDATNALLTSMPAPGVEGPTVLVVEDDARDRSVLVRALSEAGYAVEIAVSGAQALLRCGERDFDAITLDLLLPDMTGLDVLRGLRAGSRNAATPVIVVTVVGEKGAVASFRVHDILAKPLDGAALLASLQRANVPPGPSASVLVVDDEVVSLRLMETTLGTLGYRAVCSQDAAAALEIARTLRPAAVVLDLLMPGIDGFEFLERFRSLPSHRNTPVIVWTAKDLSADDTVRLGSSARAVVLKHASGTRTLLDEVRELLPTKSHPGQDHRHGG